jgi:hypothetical protein
MGESLGIPPWLIPTTLTVPQYYGLWHRQHMGNLTPAQAVEAANRIRASKGLKPLENKMPSCVIGKRTRKLKEG